MKNDAYDIGTESLTALKRGLASAAKASGHALGPWRVSRFCRNADWSRTLSRTCVNCHAVVYVTVNSWNAGAVVALFDKCAATK